MRVSGMRCWLCFEAGLGGSGPGVPMLRTCCVAGGEPGFSSQHGNIEFSFPAKPWPPQLHRPCSGEKSLLGFRVFQPRLLPKVLM